MIVDSTLATSRGRSLPILSQTRVDPFFSMTLARLLHLPFNLNEMITLLESECRIYPVKYLVDKYSALIQERLASLPVDDRKRVQGEANDAISELKGRGGAIDDAIFSVFHSNCDDKPPHRSPDEVCGSAKSIACFAPWDHRMSVLNSVHQSVVKVLKDSFKNENAQVQQALVTDVKNACPGQCKAWVEP